MPSWQDVVVLECIDKVTKPLKDITDLLSGENQVTSSAVKPLLSVINSTMLDVKDTDKPLTKEIKMAIGTDLNNRYSLSNVLLDQCSFVDPRFKQLYCTSDESVKLIISEMESIVSNNEESASVSDDSAPPTKKGSLVRFLEVSHFLLLLQKVCLLLRKGCWKLRHTCSTKLSILISAHWSGGRLKLIECLSYQR